MVKNKQAKDQIIDILNEYIVYFTTTTGQEKKETFKASNMEEAEQMMRKANWGTVYYMWKIEQVLDKGKVKKIFPL